MGQQRAMKRHVAMKMKLALWGDGTLPTTGYCPSSTLGGGMLPLCGASVLYQQFLGHNKSGTNLCAPEDTFLTFLWLMMDLPLLRESIPLYDMVNP